MEFIVTENNEFQLKLYKKIMPLEKLQEGEGYCVTCSIEDLREQNCIHLPIGLGIIIVNDPLLGTSPFCMINIFKVIWYEGFFIRLSYHFLSNSINSDMIFKKDKAIQERFIKKMLEKFKLCNVNDYGFSLERYIPENQDVHLAIIEDLKFSKSLLQ